MTVPPFVLEFGNTYSISYTFKYRAAVSIIEKNRIETENGGTGAFAKGSGIPKNENFLCGLLNLGNIG